MQGRLAIAVLLLAGGACCYATALHATGQHANAVSFAKLALVDLTVLALLGWFSGPYTGEDDVEADADD